MFYKHVVIEISQLEVKYETKYLNMALQQKDDFRKLLVKVKEKRTNATKGKANQKKSNREIEYLTVQRLSANVEGKA